jgi:signal transduction histidine kinase
MVGHDIRNPLQAIIGDVYLAKGDIDSLKKSDKKESLQESLAAIEKNTEYINKIVADLQDFARPLKPVPQETDLEAIFKELLLKNRKPENIKAASHVTKDAQKLMVDPILLNRIIGNLITNAVQAMPNGGNLSINAHRETDNIVITVKDTGVGIPDDVKPRLFTPLFTTKSKGQGFGLAVVKRMTEALNGTVTLESQQGKGATFTVTLPQKP